MLLSAKSESLKGSVQFKGSFWELRLSQLQSKGLDWPKRNILLEGPALGSLLFSKRFSLQIAGKAVDEFWRQLLSLRCRPFKFSNIQWMQLEASNYSNRIGRPAIRGHSDGCADENSLSVSRLALAKDRLNSFFFSIWRVWKRRGVGEPQRSYRHSRISMTLTQSTGQMSPTHWALQKHRVPRKMSYSLVSHRFSS